MSNELNLILKQIESTFGKFQLKNFILLILPIFLIGCYTLTYVFTAGNLEYRCQIPQCENSTAQYNSSWFPDAIPYRNFKYSKCTYYAIKNESNAKCSKETFDPSEEVLCDNLIYRDDEVTIVNAFSITCEENEWKLSLVGTVNCLGMFLFTSFAGYFSDRFGRKTIMIIGLMCCAIFGTIRSFSNTYWMFILTEFLEASLGTTAYSSIYILIMESIPTEKRVLAGAIIGVANALGEVYLGIIAYFTRNFRLLLRILYLPTFLLISYCWLIPESIRWLVMKKRYDEVKKLLENIIKVNGIEISKDLLTPLNNTKPDVDVKSDSVQVVIVNETESGSKEKVSKLVESLEQQSTIVTVLRTPFLLLRVTICAFCWLSVAFVYFGLSLNSVAFSGNKYINFILTCVVEIPGYILCYIILNRFGRRLSTSAAFVVSGIACILSQYLPVNLFILRLILFLLGKCFISFSFAAMYLYTIELYPTNMRNTLMAVCSMVGRVGAIIVPFTPLLSNIMPSLPFLLFGGLAIMSGLLLLQLPETLNVKLPDTVEEARNLGK